MNVSKFQLPFIKKEKLEGDVYIFYFDRKAVEFDYFAGQYFRITLPINNPDNRGSSRYFTMSSSPDEKYLAFTTRIIKSSFKLALSKLKAGDMAMFFGPFGEIFQDKKELTSKVMLAGGIGIAPAYSMLKFIDNKKLKVNFTTLVSFSRKKDSIFYDELKAIELRNPAVSIIYTFTKDKIKKGYEQGVIDEEKISKYAPNYKSSRFFIAGPPAMIESMQKIISNLGISDNMIIYEDFSGY